MFFNYGTNGSYEAAGQWDAGPDIGWINGGGAPAAGSWHYLVYTYDGNGAADQGTVQVYAGGVLMNFQLVGNLETHIRDSPLSWAARMTTAACASRWRATISSDTVGTTAAF
ncbi:MAG: hypothetical protein JWM59_3425 [Verrucomicrobiales bacterium]|nr:hypothetical protein [Verrucomicrobiales bacterium]